MDDYSYIDRSVNMIMHRVSEASKKFGGDRNIIVAAAVKYASDDEFLHLVRQCGIADIAENRVQQLIKHRDLLSPEERDCVRFHFIGHLQTNKVKDLIGHTVLIHSVDSLRLAEEIEKRSASLNTISRVLVEVNGAREPDKGGIMPEDTTQLCAALTEMPHIEQVGFMTMGPKFDKKSDYSNYFSETYHFMLDIWHKKLHNIREPVISMGMSDSFDTAIECGANCVRIGRAFFDR